MNYDKLNQADFEKQFQHDMEIRKVFETLVADDATSASEVIDYFAVHKSSIVSHMGSESNKLWQNACRTRTEIDVVNAITQHRSTQRKRK